jgi:hypothetical protein
MVGLLEKINYKGYGRKPSWPVLSQYSGICQDKLREATEI